MSLKKFSFEEGAKGRGPNQHRFIMKSRHKGLKKSKKMMKEKEGGDYTVNAFFVGKNWLFSALRIFCHFCQFLEKSFEERCLLSLYSQRPFLNGLFEAFSKVIYL